jgi:transcriptional regulator with XRE-family HTH domain
MPQARAIVRTLQQFAADAGVDSANLSHVLSGKRRPSRALLAKLEQALASATLPPVGS